MAASDLNQIKKIIKDAVKNLATKDDLKNGLSSLKNELLAKIDESQMQIVETVEKHKADKGDVKILERRVNKIEKDFYPA